MGTLCRRFWLLEDVQQLSLVVTDQGQVQDVGVGQLELAAGEAACESRLLLEFGEGLWMFGFLGMCGSGQRLAEQGFVVGQ